MELGRFLVCLLAGRHQGLQSKRPKFQINGQFESLSTAEKGRIKAAGRIMSDDGWKKTVAPNLPFPNFWFDLA
jgi:hypothetical protein